MSSQSASDTTILDSLLEHEIASSLGGSSVNMMRCMDLAEIVSQSRVPVLITGEGGAGKSLMARHIHNISPRRSRPCVILKCVGLREREIKSRLFGNKNSEVERRGGLLGEAGGGTLILDGVEYMSGSVQRELLQILRDSTRSDDAAGDGTGTGKRLGARLISTSRGGPLTGASGVFLEELWYGLGEVVLRIPPLRERREDIEPMAARALRAANRVHGKKVQMLSRSARDFIRHYGFPGNLRELFFIIDRAVRNTTRDAIYVEDLGMVVESQTDDPHIFSDATLLPLSELEKRHINKALLRTGWKRNAAARILRITETMLDRKIKLYGLERGK